LNLVVHRETAMP